MNNHATYVLQVRRIVPVFRVCEPRLTTSALLFRAPTQRAWLPSCSDTPVSAVQSHQLHALGKRTSPPSDYFGTGLNSARSRDQINNATAQPSIPDAPCPWIIPPHCFFFFFFISGAALGKARERQNDPQPQNTDSH